jgi:hypothetical protein
MDRDRPQFRKGWQELAAEAATEIDDGRLMELIEELCHALDSSRKQRPSVVLPTEDCV